MDEGSDLYEMHISAQADKNITESRLGGLQTRQINLEIVLLLMLLLLLLLRRGRLALVLGRISDAVHMADDGRYCFYCQVEAAI
jgi:hypothetical protein